MVVHDADQESSVALASTASDAAHLRNLNALYAGMLHSLRGPVNAISMNLELLRVTREDETDTAARKRDLRCIDQIGKEVARLTALVEAVGEQLAPDDGGWQPVDLAQLLRDLELLVAAQARSQRVTLHITAPDEPVLVNGRRRELQRTLLGLLAIRLRPMQDGGQLTATLEIGEQQALLSIRTAEHEAADGQESLPTLEWAACVATRHGGSVVVKPPDDAGSCVQFRLPRTKAGDAAVRE